MPNLKDTDIDDLFRRASEKYPLRTDSSDWDRMVAALEKDPPPPDDGTDTTDERRKRRFFWLFLLLPLGVGGLGYYAWHSGARTKAGTTAKTSVVTNTPAAIKKSDASKASDAINTPDTINTPDAAHSTGSTLSPAAVNTSAAAKTTAVNTPSGTKTSSGTKTRAAYPSAASRTPTPTAPTTAAGRTTAAPTALATTRVDRSHLADASHPTNASHLPVADDAFAAASARRQPSNNHRNKAGHQTNASHLPGQNDADAGATTGANASTIGTSTPATGANTPATGANTPASGTNASTTGTNASASGNPFSTSLTQNRQDRLFYDLQREPVDRNYQLKVNVAAPAAKKDSTAAKQKASHKTKTSYLYAGLIGAPDLSTVKMQSVKGVGNTFGVLVGYAFNSHWAIETGAYLDRKKYYTEGQYFNTKEISWLTAADTLKNVNGTCYMWEIPLNLRYTFNPEAKTRWFVTAGFTTYLMTKEKYTYNYEWSGWNINKTGIQDSSSHYPFSIIGLSAGFEQKLGKVGNLRIEPYLRIPLTGMGAGKLPIMSTGINIGITRQLWKK